MLRGRRELRLLGHVEDPHDSATRLSTVSNSVHFIMFDNSIKMDNFTHPQKCRTQHVYTKEEVINVLGDNIYRKFESQRYALRVVCTNMNSLTHSRLGGESQRTVFCFSFVVEAES